MIEERGKVVATDGQLAWVETLRASTCGQCAANKGCGVGGLARFFSGLFRRVRVLNSVGAKVGDEVVLGLEERALLRSALAMYLVPLLGLLGGGMAGELIGQRLSILGESMTIAGALSGLCASVLAVRRYSRVLSADPTYQPVILRML